MIQKGVQSIIANFGLAEIQFLKSFRPLHFREGCCGNLCIVELKFSNVVEIGHSLQPLRIDWAIIEIHFFQQRKLAQVGDASARDLRGP